VGSVLPRPYRGIIHGFDEENSLLAGQSITITANGYNMSLESPRDKRFRWIPVSWRLSDGTSGNFTSETPFQADISFNNTGEQWLYITYFEEIFDKNYWQRASRLHEVRERLLEIQ
jgi:hypothetical protein